MSGIGLGPFDQLGAVVVEHATVVGGEVPVIIMTIPKAWVLVMPCGRIDGFLHGSNRHATPEAAWATFSPLKRTRDAEARKGWTVRPATSTEIANTEPAPCPHDEAVGRTVLPIEHEGHSA
ncbi:MAG: hypothetical protein JWP85_2096 [Rhodoglobus sp.]|nr:hypothetical protein [Rhodoglobus sp.]